MKIKSFKLERYFAKYEFSTPYLLSSSDCEPLSLQELLAMSDDDSLKMWNNLKLGYTESQGHPVLCEEISKLYQTVKPEEALVLTPEEGIFIAMNSILEKGSHVITTFPAYQSLYEIAQSLECEVSKWTPKEQDTWFFDINDLKNLIKENTRLIVINFPHNPTGVILKEEELKEIIDLAKKKNIIVFSDEMYKYLEFDQSNRISSASDLYENAVSLFGMSKTFGLAGLRIGWLVTKNTDLLNRFIKFKDYTTICNSAPSEILAILALKTKEKIIQRNLEIINKNLQVLGNFFIEYKQLFKWYKPKAGSICFPKLCLDIEVADFCKDLIKKGGVMLLPATVYDYAGNNFRIGFGRRNMDKVVGVFKNYLDEYY